MKSASMSMAKAQFKKNKIIKKFLNRVSRA